MQECETSRMELNKKSQENCGSSTNLQADQMIVYMIDCHEDNSDERIKELNKDRDRKIEEIRNKKYAKVTLNIPYDDFGSREENLLKHGLANFLQISIEEISIEMKERGSTEITISLPRHLSDKVIKQLLCQNNKEDISILDTIINVNILKQQDAFHAVKRKYAFDLYDIFLDHCMKGICPLISQAHSYYLIDISIEGYIANRAYYYSIDEIGRDSQDRFFIAQKKGKIMLECCVKKPSLNKEIFNEDQNQINKQYYKNAVKRKAYWNMLSGKYKNSKEDYSNALYFVDKIKELYDRGINKKQVEVLQELKELLVENLNIASALDMYKFCFLRQCLNEKLE